MLGDGVLPESTSASLSALSSDVDEPLETLRVSDRSGPPSTLLDPDMTASIKELAV